MCAVCRVQPPELIACIALEVIDLSDNEFAEFPEVLTLLPSLREINLSDNQIKALPASMKNLSSLRILNVSRNDIESIEVRVPQREKMAKKQKRVRWGQAVSRRQRR